MKLKRSSGILLHITSLPGQHGIGTIGPEAYRFADLLKAAGQKYWQILPIGPVDSSQAYSPYASTSTFAGNYLFISPVKLAEEEWFSGEVYADEFTEDHFVYFDDVTKYMTSLLKEALKDFKLSAGAEDRESYHSFIADEGYWLKDFALYEALAGHYETNNWLLWDKDVRRRDPAALDSMSSKLADSIEYHTFVQYIFFKQWAEFKEHCRKTGIELIGDIPIYITLEGADAWAHPEILQLDKKTEKPVSIAGVPPDYFSETGQRWGNPIYRWTDNGTLHEETFQWWSNRISHLGKLVDIIRIDHFRGFEAYWAIPYEEKTAINGTWVKGPGIDFFHRLKDKLGDLPLIAEDLGVITPEVEKLRDDLELPGMKILQFAFDFNNKNYYLPHSMENPNCILYTGTHDNNTTNGWFYEGEIDDGTREYILNYLGVSDKKDFHWTLIRQAYRTVSRLIIIPAQDILGYGAKFRMNTPGTIESNWGWKLTEGAVSEEIIQKLKRMGELYNRIPERDDEDE